MFRESKKEVDDELRVELIPEVKQMPVAEDNRPITSDYCIPYPALKSFHYDSRCWPKTDIAYHYHRALQFDGRNDGALDGGYYLKKWTNKISCIHVASCFVAENIKDNCCYQAKGWLNYREHPKAAKCGSCGLDCCSLICCLPQTAVCCVLTPFAYTAGTIRDCCSDAAPEEQRMDDTDIEECIQALEQENLKALIENSSRGCAAIDVLASHGRYRGDLISLAIGYKKSDVSIRDRKQLLARIFERGYEITGELSFGRIIPSYINSALFNNSEGAEDILRFILSKQRVLYPIIEDRIQDFFSTYYNQRILNLRKATKLLSILREFGLLKTNTGLPNELTSKMTFPAFCMMFHSRLGADSAMRRVNESSKIGIKNTKIKSTPLGLIFDFVDGGNRIKEKAAAETIDNGAGMGLVPGNQ